MSTAELDKDDRLEDEEEESEEEEEEEEDEDEEEEAPKKSAAKPAPIKSSASSDSGFISTLKNTWTIAKRELRAYFDSLVAYVVIGLSMLGLGGYFFFYPGGFWQVDRATMMRLFDFAPGALCLVVPLVTMGVLAGE